MKEKHSEQDKNQQQTQPIHGTETSTLITAISLLPKYCTMKDKPAEGVRKNSSPHCPADLQEQVIQSSCSQLTILAAIPPAPAVPRRIYLTLATCITALTIWVVNIRSPLILLLTRLLVTSGNSLCGVLINVLIFLCCRISKE